MTWADTFLQSQLDKYFKKIREPEKITVEKKTDTRPFKFMQEEPPKKPNLFVVIDTTPKKIIKSKLQTERKASLDAIAKASGCGISTTPIHIRDDIDELPQPVKKIYVDNHSPKFN